MRRNRNSLVRWVRRLKHNVTFSLMHFPILPIAAKYIYQTLT